MNNALFKFKKHIQCILRAGFACRDGYVSKSWNSCQLLLRERHAAQSDRQQCLRASVHDFAEQNLFSKLGLKKFKWDFVPNSTHQNDFGQVHLTSRDMGKFGLRYLNNGKWEGKQVIPASFVQQSLAPHSIVDGIPYGYLWWCEDLSINGKVFTGKAAKGNGGQRIFLFPEQNLVAVITAGNYNTKSPSNRLLMECVLPGLAWSIYSCKL